MSKTTRATGSIKSIGVLAGLVLKALLAGAQNVPPPPKPDTGPSLEVTMKYIEDKLNAVKFTYTTHMPDWDKPLFIATSITNAKTSPKDCSLSWTEFVNYPSAQTVTDMQLSLKDARNVVVQTEADWLRRKTSLLADIEVHPDVYYLSINMQQGRMAHQHQSNDQEGHITKDDSDQPLAELVLPDKEYAERLAKAFVHAVELCGGGDNDPFR